MFEFFGLLLRLPFFILGIVLWTIIGPFLWILATIFLTVCLPIQFIDAAFSNDKNRWDVAQNEYLLFVQTFFTEPYQNMYRWLTGR